MYTYRKIGIISTERAGPLALLYEEPSFLASTAILMSIHSAMNIRIPQQIGGGVNGWSYY